MDCNIKLLKQLFVDSKVCQTVHCGRTKLDPLAERVLCPVSIERHLNEINGKKFSIASDASNMGNIKLFPIGVQYFNVKTGIINFVLDFYEDSNETSDAIHTKLVNRFNDNELSLNNMIGYSGDNTSVNYGKYHSVFQKFKQRNDYLVKANCNSHVLHNTVKYAFNKMPFDVENLVMKIYSHFNF